MKRSKTNLTLPVQYTDDELADKRDRLSAALLEYDTVEDQKKSATSQYSESPKALRGEMRQLAKQIKRKGEERSVGCIVQFHHPSPAFKTIIREDTGEIVRQEAMSYEESQDNLFEESEEIQGMFDAPDNRPPKTEEPPEQQTGQ